MRPDGGEASAHLVGVEVLLRVDRRDKLSAGVVVEVAFRAARGSGKGANARQVLAFARE